MKKPLLILPEDIERDFGAYLDRTVMPPAADGHFMLVEAKRTDGGSGLGQRIEAQDAKIDALEQGLHRVEF